MKQVEVHIFFRPPIPVTVIGGFLGAGKKTLLKSILSENLGKESESKIALVSSKDGINETELKPGNSTKKEANPKL